MTNIHKTILIVGALVILLVDGFMFVYSKTLQRSAQDLATIEMAKSYSEHACITDRGSPARDYAGTMVYCEHKK